MSPTLFKSSSPGVRSAKSCLVSVSLEFVGFSFLPRLVPLLLSNLGCKSVVPGRVGWFVESIVSSYCAKCSSVVGITVTVQWCDIILFD